MCKIIKQNVLPVKLKQKASNSLLGSARHTTTPVLPLPQFDLTWTRGTTAICSSTHPNLRFTKKNVDHFFHLQFNILIGWFSIMQCFYLHVSRPCFWASDTCALLAIVKPRCSQRSLAADALKAYVFPMEASNTPEMACLGFTVHQRKKKEIEFNSFCITHY